MTNSFEKFLRREQELQWIEEMVASWDRQLNCIPTMTDEDLASPAHSGVSDKYFEKHIKRVDFGGPPPRGKPKPSQAIPSQVTVADVQGVHRAISIRR